MPKGVVGKVPKGKAVRRLEMKSDKGNGHEAVRPEKTPRKKRSVFKSLLDKYSGMKDLTPRKLEAITQAIADSDDSDSAWEWSGDEGGSDAGESVAPRGASESEGGPSGVASHDSDHGDDDDGDDDGDRTPVESDDDYQPSEVDEVNDFQGYEDVSQAHAEAMEDDRSSPSSDSEDEHVGRTRAVCGRRAAGHRRALGGKRRMSRSEGRPRRRGRLSAVSSRSRSPTARVGGAEEEDEEGWTQDATPPTTHPFTANPRMTVPIPTTPLGFFQLFVSYELLVFFMEETNDYATYMRCELKKKSAYPWSGCNVIDIARYLGIVMWMGIIDLPEVRMFWARNKTYSMSAFGAAMGRRRFEAIGKYFHTFNRRAIPKDNPDKLIVLRPVMEYIRERCKSLYVPQKNLSIDEGMLKWKGRLSIKVYNPQKPTKYGIKFYFLCESKSGYVLDFIIYRGVSSSLRDIVFNLMEPHLNQGYHVFMDNFYNSVALADELYSNNTHCSGTLRIQRGAPKVLRNVVRNKTLRRGDMAWRRKDNTFVICWQDLRCVNFITNFFNADTEEFIHKRKVKRGGRYVHEDFEIQRPKMVKEYISYMGGVDLFDQLINYYSFARRSNRWTKKTVFYLLQLALLNSFTLYCTYRTDRRRKRLTLREYHELIADALLYYDETLWSDSGNRIPHAPSLPENERADRVPRDQEELPEVGSIQDEQRVDDPDIVPDPHQDTPAIQHAGPAMQQGTPTASQPAAAASRPATPASRQHTPPTPVHDNPDRLRPGNHVEERIGAIRQQKKCRVCYLSGRRQDTTFQCAQCKVALCVYRRDCFRRYHTLDRYWSTPPPGVKTGKRVRRS